MLTHLSIHQLRNLHTVHIAVDQCNVIVGANGSGKTSLLESLYLLSRGKSFRHHQPKRYISHHAPNVTVHARFANGTSMAIQKAQDASSLMRLDQQPVYVQSALTKRLPTMLIDPSSMDILEVGSGSRRQLLDWITFHVKPGFHPQWMAYQRLLKQRNALLKQSNKLTSYQIQELSAWDKGLANHAALITHYRQQAFDEWHPLFNEMVQQLLPDYAPFIQLRFMPGYNTEQPLDDLLQQRLAQDCQSGYTRIGCHRADVQVLWVEDIEARQQALVQQRQTSATDFNSTQATYSQQSQNYLQQKVATESTSYVINSHENNAHKMKNHEGASQSVDSKLQSSIEVDQQNESEMQNSYGDKSKHNVDADLDSYGLESKAVLGKVREQAANVLSRGEKKLLITALRLSQLPLLAELATEDNLSTNESNLLPLVLLDDITAELDERALDILLNSLSQLPCQVFITSLEVDVMAKIKQYWPDVHMFHMKHGVVEDITN